MHTHVRKSVCSNNWINKRAIVTNFFGEYWLFSLFWRNNYTQTRAFVNAITFYTQVEIECVYVFMKPNASAETEKSQYSFSWFIYIYRYCLFVFCFLFFYITIILTENFNCPLNLPSLRGFIFNAFSYLLKNPGISNW